MGVVPTHQQMKELTRLMMFCVDNVESDLVEEFVNNIDMLDIEEWYRGMVC
jgi:hypothetical protein